MKKRLEKKVEKMRRKKVHEVLEMVLEINGTHPRRRELTDDKPTAFFSFSGHTASIDVSVNENGWASYVRTAPGMYAYMDIEGFPLEDVKNELGNIMEELRHAGKM